MTITMIYLSALLVVFAGAGLTYAKSCAPKAPQLLFERYRPMLFPTFFVIFIFPLAIEHPERPVISFVLGLNVLLSCLNLWIAASYLREAKTESHKKP